MSNESDVLSALHATLEARKQADPDSSYVASLYASGVDRILKKVGEEAAETLIAAKDAKPGNTSELVHEVADLWFHSMVLLAHFDESHEAVLEVLAGRFGLSGLEEKASRSKQ